MRAINKELTFPFQVKITYQHDITDENGQNKRVTETQTTCEQVGYVVDSTLIDPRKVLPDFLLYDFVDFLQGSVKTLAKAQEQINKVLDYVAIGCLFSFGAHLAARIYRIWVDLANEKLFLLSKGTFLNSFNLGSIADTEYCNNLRDAVQKSYGSLKMKYFSDSDLKKCFPSSYAAWHTETKVYELQRWSCDRVFGHAAPSKWTEKEKDEDLHRKITTQKSSFLNYFNCLIIESRWNGLVNKLNAKC